MADPLILTTLRSKQAEIERHIDSLNVSLSQARADLFHVAACLRMFDPEPSGESGTVKAYAGAAKAMKRTEMFSLCKAALDASGEPLDTRELAAHVIKARENEVQSEKLMMSPMRRSLPLENGGWHTRSPTQKFLNLFRALSKATQKEKFIGILRGLQK